MYPKTWATIQFSDISTHLQKWKDDVAHARKNSGGHIIAKSVPPIVPRMALTLHEDGTLGAA